MLKKKQWKKQNLHKDEFVLNYKQEITLLLQNTIINKAEYSIF